MEKNLENMPVSEIFSLADVIAPRASSERGPSEVVLADKDGMKVALISLNEGDGLPAHTPPGDAILTILEGSAALSISGRTLLPEAWQSVAMPAGVERSLKALTPLKMLLMFVKDGASCAPEGTGCCHCGK